MKTISGVLLALGLFVGLISGLLTPPLSFAGGALSSLRSVEPPMSETDREIQEFLTQLAEPAPQKLVWYRWGTGQVERRRIGSHPVFDLDSTNPGKIAAGKGLYVCENPVSSVRYGAKAVDPDLITITAPAGTLVLDLFSKRVKTAMQARGLTEQDVYRTNPPVMVHFSPSYWALKSAEGVKAHDFDGRHIPTQDLFMYGSFLRHEHLRLHFEEKIKPTLANRVFRPGHPGHTTVSDSDASANPPEQSRIRKAMQEYYWRYDGSCGAYAKDPANPDRLHLLQRHVEPDACRRLFPTVEVRDDQGNPVEYVQGEPRIWVRPIPPADKTPPTPAAAAVELPRDSRNLNEGRDYFDEGFWISS